MSGINPAEFYARKRELDRLQQQLAVERAEHEIEKRQADSEVVAYRATDAIFQLQRERGIGFDEAVELYQRGVGRVGVSDPGPNARQLGYVTPPVTIGGGGNYPVADWPAPMGRESKWLQVPRISELSPVGKAPFVWWDGVRERRQETKSLLRALEDYEGGAGAKYLNGEYVTTPELASVADIVFNLPPKATDQAEKLQLLRDLIEFAYPNRENLRPAA
jgi:hypothetical protein